MKQVALRGAALGAVGGVQGRAVVSGVQGGGGGVLRRSRCSRHAQHHIGGARAVARGRQPRAEPLVDARAGQLLQLERGAPVARSDDLLAYGSNDEKEDRYDSRDERRRYLRRLDQSAREVPARRHEDEERARREQQHRRAHERRLDRAQPPAHPLVDNGADEALTRERPQHLEADEDESGDGERAVAARAALAPPPAVLAPPPAVPRWRGGRSWRRGRQHRRHRRHWRQRQHGRHQRRGHELARSAHGWQRWAWRREAAAIAWRRSRGRGQGRRQGRKRWAVEQVVDVPTGVVCACRRPRTEHVLRHHTGLHEHQ